MSEKTAVERKMSQISLSIFFVACLFLFSSYHYVETRELEITRRRSKKE
jgi:hypothetical protein